MRGAGLSSQEEGVGRPFQTQFQRPVLTGSGLGHSRQGRSPTAETVRRAEARPVLLVKQQFGLSLWPAGHQLPGDPEPPSLSGPALSRGAWGWWP